MATKRILRKPKEIRDLIDQNGIKYIMLNNRLFDDFYTKGKVQYRPVLVDDKTFTDYKGNTYSHQDYSDKSKVLEATFDEKDFIILIFLKFLSHVEFKGYSLEVANYLGYKSDKRLKQRLKKLQFLQGLVNNRYLHRMGKREIFDEPRNVRLIKEKKVNGVDDNLKRRTYYQWIVGFDCDYKQETDVKTGEILYTPVNFFSVTINDLDLITSGKLTAAEFITYLYLVRSYDSKNGKAIAHSVSKISEKVNIKDVSITQAILKRLKSMRIVDEYCNDGEDLPLIHVSKPNNYGKNVMRRKEPSLYFDPIYNHTTVQKIQGNEPNPYPNADKTEESNADTNQTNRDTYIYEDSDQTNWDIENPF